MITIKTINAFAVGVTNDYIVIMNPPRAGKKLSRQQALEFAAWIYVLANSLGEDDNENLAHFGHLTDKIAAS